LSEATVGILLQDAETGEVLIDFNADQLFAPASVNKLFTVAAALWRLGPAFVWQTPIAYRGQRVGERSETLEADLWALGRGAPDTVEEQLWLASRAIYRRGISRVTGDLVVDDRFFDAARFGEGWPGGAQTSESYHAPISALMANYSARREGTEWVAVADPAMHFGERLKELLGLAGVRLEGRVRAPSAAELETFVVPADVDPGNSRMGIPEGLELLYTIDSEPLGRLAFDVNKFSNNVMAENILKTLGAAEYGHPGTATKGLAVIARFRNEVLGTELTGYVQADGSGLSDLNRVSPRQVAELLHHAYADFHLGPEFVASLKISGLDGWNPRAFRDPPLLGEMRLKSGHIRGVNTLSGYAHAESGRVVAFCMMINGHRSQQWEIDQRVAELSQIILSSY
jgi:D-alanyl-D-alanine carboxypeptidase/D-alanyl-D-alanine-endopeptidase (penicillin-binding protein 4)